MTREQLIKAIYDNDEQWSCPDNPCDKPEEEGNTGECCMKCAEEQLAWYEQKIRADATRWIPVSERLPKDRNTVLVTAYWHETYQVMEASYYGDGLWWCVPFNNCGEHMQKLNPKAWMPLPEPYREEQKNGR